MAFDLEAVLKLYNPADKTAADRASSQVKACSFDARETLGIVGLGGTMSSGYSYAHETIVPGMYKPAAVVLQSIQDMFGTIGMDYAVIDLFAKDSRDIVDDDMLGLLHFVHAAKSRKILLTCGTYLLTQIAALLERSDASQGKIIGVTGSMLPQGFMFSDAPGNILGTLSAMDMAARFIKPDEKCVLVGFHGQVHIGSDEFKKLNLHPEHMKEVVLVSPQANLPVIPTKSKA